MIYKTILVGLLTLMVGCSSSGKFVQSLDFSELEGEYNAYSQVREYEKGIHIAHFFGDGETNDISETFTFVVEQGMPVIVYKYGKGMFATERKIPIEGKRRKAYIKQNRELSILPFFPVLGEIKSRTLYFGKDKLNNILIMIRKNKQGMLLGKESNESSDTYFVYKKVPILK